MLRRYRSIFTSVYVAVQKLKEALARASLLQQRIELYAFYFLVILRKQVAEHNMFSESSSRSSLESEEKTRHNLRRISASEERTMNRMMELVRKDQDQDDGVSKKGPGS
uniref:Uncharacterized protein n=1 Tax=Tanacetum cinerariifolium TaxID=118510 RepID=A0A6L2K7J1_TANCI|nr:hypothetical protein [Tanacetum cinerariifolium]